MNDDLVVPPLDDHDRRLLSQVCPDNWRNPTPSPLYDLVIIGGGTAGLVCAVGAAGLGARVAIVERARLGGDCLNTGCVPSKTLLRAARAVRDARSAAAVGISVSTQVDFAAVMASVRERRADLADRDSAARLTSLGVDVFLGEASFADRRTVTVAGVALRFRRAVIASGGRPLVPPIGGLTHARCLTTETVFSLVEQPRSMLVMGGGPVGCELAQAFALLGTSVTLIETAPRVLPREDAEAAEIVQRQLCADGVRVVTSGAVVEIDRDVRAGRVIARLDGEDLSAEALLLATGRAPNIEQLNLQAAGVEHGAHGIDVDEWLRTSNHRVYAAGDVCSRFHFTHAADALARVVVQNALFPWRRRASSLVIPWSIYTFPEVAHVGLSPKQAIEIGAQPITISLADVDRAVIDGESDGFVRIHHRRGQIVAATIVSSRAGELIGYVASMMRRRAPLAELSHEIFPYPTLAEALRKAGDAYRRTQLTPRAKRWLDRYLALARRF